VQASYPPATPSNHAHNASHASNDSKATCKGQELFDLGRILNRPESDLTTARNRQTVIVSLSTSEEQEANEEATCSRRDSRRDESGEGKSEMIPPMILKTMSVIVESTRAVSFVEEDIEAQGIEDKRNSE
jgi:hypothetical protein